MTEHRELCVLVLAALRGRLRETPASLFHFPWRSLATAAGPGEPYGRTVVHASELGEVMVASWTEGARSAIHDHGGAEGCVVVVEGSFDEVVYEFTNGALAAVDEREHGERARLDVARGTIHSMRARRGGLTLHAYARADGPMRLYDTDARVSWLVDDGGAWLPSAHVVGREPWERLR